MPSTTIPNEEDGLLRSNKPRTESFEEYGSVGMAVFESANNGEPVILHDLTGPLLLKDELLERHESMMTTISKATTVAEMPHEDVPAGQATIPSEVASMSKNLVGCGALSLCNGIALCSNMASGVIAANIWILIMGVIFGYFCWLIAKVCEITGRTTYRGIWQVTVGHTGSVAVSVANGLKAGLSNLAYATILSDTLRSLFESIGLDVPRVVCLVLITVLAILPLCMLKNLHVLAPFSICGTAGVMVTAVAMAIRYFDGSYQEGGQYYDQIDAVYQPDFGTRDDSWSIGILPFVCMVYESYVMHYNSPRFYTELKDRSLPRFGIAVGSSFSLAAVLYMAIASFGFLTFGGNSSGFILNNYSPHDPLATICRLCIGLAVLTAYPIVFFGVRDSVLDVFEVPQINQTPNKLNALTFAILGILTFTAVFVTDLGLINAVGGGLVATAVCFAFPTIMLASAVRQKLNGCGDKSDQRQTVASILVTIFGMAVGISGVYTALSKAFARP
eukprot:CAMPEP_0198155554 /NCGR_PEP_ID=MMETSP1443-20131203/69195_1 /TAXON_ID=186043 /ORGANISM="Entomoneis sp., Strain CCMP2396" /LENGTH=502 /DNA_ID=CAMNT_0043822309 /DNA_START=27 /DNA_END=1535 /DNA_ORIENTATION=+